jgi:hypothetical protein
LDDEAGDASPQDRRLAAHVWPLCERHADTLKVPRGWFCVDRRAARFGPADADPAPAPGPGAGPEAAATTPGGDGAKADGGRGPSGAPGPGAGGRLSSIL